LDWPGDGDSRYLSKTVQNVKEDFMNKYGIAVLVTASVLASPAAFAQARVAVAHFAPFADSLEGTAVDIRVNGETALQNVRFKDFTDYLEFDAGTYTIDIVPVGAAAPAITGEFTLEDGNDYSLFAVGNGSTQPLELWALLDNVTDPAAGSLNIRIVHAAPFAADLAATEVSIRTDGGDLVNGLTGVPYGVDSGFFAIPAGNYDLKVASNDGSVNYIDIDAVDLPAGADVTVYAVGDGINQPLGVIAFPVGELPTSTPVDNRSNGMWEIVEGSGTGFVFQPMPSQDRVAGTWYTYDVDGNATFLTFDSCQNAPGADGCAVPAGFDGTTAITALYASSGGGPNEDDMVETTRVGKIEFEILGCDDATATVTLDGGDPVLYTARQLTRPFPCSD
jgi:Domain of unknown function (DUF4397)